MEFLRIQDHSASSIIIFIGFLLTSSLSMYHPFEGSLTEAFPEMLWLGIIAVTLFVLVFGFITYLVLDRCCFMIQVAQYILFPLCTVSIIQKCYIIKSTSLTTAFPSLVPMMPHLIMMVPILFLLMVKIVYLNQTFPGYSHKQVLHFQLFVRIFRIIKMVGISIFYFILGHDQDFVIVAIIANCIDAIFIYRQFTFIRIQNEETLLLAAVNNIMSIFIHIVLAPSTAQVVTLQNISKQNPFIYKYFSQFTLTCMFFFIPNCMRSITQLKISSYLNSLELNRNNFQKDETKKIIIILLSCFYKIYTTSEKEQGNSQYSSNLGVKNNKLILKNQEKDSWSNMFITKLKKTYQFILYFYLVQISHGSQSSLGSLSIKNAKIQLKDNQLQNKIRQIYNSTWKKNATFFDILQDRKLFFNFVSFCMDTLENKQLKNLPWSYSNEFFLIFACKLQSRFILKKMFYYTRRLNLTDQSVLYHARNRKVGHYLRYCKNFNKMSQTALQKYLVFEQSLTQLKIKFLQICNQQISLVEKLASPILNTFKCQKSLQKRQKNKMQLQVMFQNNFSKDQYLYFQEFAYLYLLFMVIFCKSINKTGQKIREKYIIPTKNNKKQQLSGKGFKNGYNMPILVCCALDNGKVKFGQILITNEPFRKKFSPCFTNSFSSSLTTSILPMATNSNSYQSGCTKISDLLPTAEQKLTHLNLMFQKCKFSDFMKEKKPHKDHKCFLKINLQCDYFNVLQEFSIDTQIFFSCEENIYYLCVLQQAKEQVYVGENEYKKLMAKLPQMGINKDIIRTSAKQLNNPLLASQTGASMLTISKPIQHNQLSQKMSLISVATSQLHSLGLLKAPIIRLEEYDSMHIESSLIDYKQQFLNQESHKFAKIEAGIWNRSSRPEKKLMVMLVMILLGFFGVSTVTVVSMVYIGDFHVQANTASVGITDMIVNVQATPFHLGNMVNMMRGINNGFITSDICKQFLDQGDEMANFNKWARSRAKTWTDMIKGYFWRYGDHGGIMPVFQPSFGGVQQFQNQIDKEVKNDFSNYIYNVLAETQHYFYANLTNQSSNLYSWLRTHTYLGKKSPAQKTLKELFKLTELSIDSLLRHTRVVYTMATVGIIALAVLFYIGLIKAYMEHMKYFQLIGKLEEDYFYHRIKEMKYIIQQISASSSFYHIDFISSTQIKIQKHSKLIWMQDELNQHENSSLVGTLTLDQFEKLPHQSEYHSLQLQRPAPKSRLSIMLSSKKYTLLSLMVLTILIVMCFLTIGILQAKAIQDNNFYVRVLKEGQQYRQEILVMLWANWMAYIDQNSTSSKIRQFQDIEAIVQRSFNYLKKKQFFNIVLEKLNKESLDNCFYINACNISQFFQKSQIFSQNFVTPGLFTNENIDMKSIFKNFPFDSRKCESHIQQLSQLRLFELSSIIAANQNWIFQNFAQSGYSSFSHQSLTLLCKDTKTILSYLQPSLLMTIPLVFSSLQADNVKLPILQFLLLILLALLGLFLFCQLYYRYYKINGVIKFQVLTMDTPKDLYSYTSQFDKNQGIFHSDLNKILFKHYK